MLPRISIEQQYAALGIKTTPAQLHIKNHSPQMEIVQEEPQMSVERQAPRFRLNWKKVRSESGLKLPIDLTKSRNIRANQNTMDQIGKTVRDGNFLGKVEQKGNRVAQLARRDLLKTAEKEAVVSSMPKSSPEVEWDPGFLHVKWSRHKFRIEWSGEYMPEFVIDPKYSIEIFLRDKPYIKVTVEDAVDPYEGGRTVDEKL